MWYLLALSLLFLPFQLRAALALLLVTLGLAVLNHTLTLPAIVVLLLAGGVALWCRTHPQRTPLTLAAEALLVICAGALLLHKIPGFTNQMVVSGVQVGPLSTPFTFWFNFDKALIPFVLLGCLPTLLKCPAQPPKNPLWWLVLLLMMPLLLLIATFAGGLRVELHLPEWLGSFMLANLFFVSLAEEALFRGWLQQRLGQWLGSIPALLIASLLFGLVHISGGWLLVIFATLSGVIYGLAWLWSGRLWVAALVHFAFNMLHLLCFTYPMWNRLAA